MTTPFSSMLLVFGAGIIGSIAAVSLKSGANRLGGGMHHIFLSWRVALGVLLYLLS